MSIVGIILEKVRNGEMLEAMEKTLERISLLEHRAETIEESLARQMREMRGKSVPGLYPLSDAWDAESENAYRPIIRDDGHGGFIPGAERCDSGRFVKRERAATLRTMLESETAIKQTQLNEVARQRERVSDHAYVIDEQKVVIERLTLELEAANERVRSLEESRDLCLSDALPLPRMARDVVRGAFVGTFSPPTEEKSDEIHS